MIGISTRIAEYAYRHWQRAGMTEWPTVRQVARAMKVPQSVVEESDGYDHYMLTGYNYQDEDERIGDLYVEASIPAVDVAWCGYWLPYSRGCFCGKHTYQQSTNQEK